MKKSILLAAIFAAFSAQAASFTWGTDTTAVSFDGTVLAGNATAYLVYLGSSTDTTKLWTLKADEIVGATPVTSQVTSTAKRTAGRVSNSYASADIQNGNVYGAYVKYVDGDKTWFNFSATTYTVSGISLGTEALTADTFVFNFSTKSEINPAAQTPVAGGGWYRAVAVPEPSTAMLALAGLALLIKRRRA